MLSLRLSPVMCSQSVASNLNFLAAIRLKGPSDTLKDHSRNTDIETSRMNDQGRRKR